MKTQKVAIITGASRGIGAATATLLAAHHYAVCVNYHANEAKAKQLVDDICQQGGKAIAVKADLRQEQHILTLFQQVDSQLGPVTALINNAGDNGGISTVDNISYETLQSVFSLNVFATFLCSREAIKRMKHNHGGNIINISSEAGKFGGNQLAHYAASKAAINTFTIGCAREVATDNIRVNTISPGVINTEIHQDSPPERIAKLQSSLPMGRMGEPTEIAKTILWLLSDDASYISGAVIPVTGAR